jgi:hypothetical protein
LWWEVLSGLGEVGGAAEVAPVVLVGAEGEDFLVLGGEVEIGVDDGEDAGLVDLREEAGGEDVDAGEGEWLERFGGADDFERLVVANFWADAAAGELEVVVEQEVAPGGAVLDGEGGEGLRFIVGLDHAREIDGADNVDVVEKEGFVEASRVFEEKPGGFFEAAAGVEEDFFARDLDAHVEIIFGFEVVKELIGEMVDVEDEFGDALGAEAGDGDFEEGAAGEFDESFGARIGERAEAGSETGGQDHGFHEGRFSFGGRSGE